MTTCPACGASVAADNNFCPNCGGKLRAHTGDTTRVIPVVSDEFNDGVDLSSEQQTAVEALPKGSALLIVQRGPDAGARYLLDGDGSVAGRHPGCDIFLDDITVSRRHAEVVRTADGYRLRDAGSLNGTYLNQQRIDGDVPMANGDELQVGKFKLVYLAGQGS